MQCTKCNSDNTQRLEVVFENGTQNINTNSHSAGAGFGGSFGVGGVTTKTSGTSQSIVGGKAAPPPEKSYKWPAIFMFIGFCFAGSGAGFTSYAVGLPIIAIGGFFGYRAFQYNSTEWPPLYQLWQESWLCNKCGTIYHQP